MLARCARCQGTFTTDRYGRQTCPHCGSELLLPPPAGAPAPPGAAPEGGPASESAPPPERGEGQGPGPQGPTFPPPPVSGTAGAGGGTELPPPPGPPPGGYGGPHSGWGPPPGGGWSPPPGGGWGPPPGPPPGPRGESPSPFADRARLGFFHAFFETWKLVATQPEAFFSRVRVDQTGTAILFGIIATTVGTLFSSFYSWLSSRQVLGAMEGMLQGMSEEHSRFMRMWIDTYASGALAAAQIVLTPVLVFIASYVLAAFLHLMLKLFRGAHRGFDATLTVVAYVNGLGLLLAVPGCGSILVLVWTSIATIIGLAAVHRCSVTRATLAVLAPGVLLLVCCCGSLGGMLPALIKAGQEATKPGQTTTL